MSHLIRRYWHWHPLNSICTRNIRFFATKRTVPYVRKGMWNLLEIPTEKFQASSLESEEPNTDHPDTPNVSLNLPKNWRNSYGLPQWKRQNFALREKFPEGWRPRRKLNRNEMDELRALKKAQNSLSNDYLANHFKTSPEAVRRIIKSKWRPSEKEAKKQNERWKRRGEKLKKRTPPNTSPYSLGRIEDSGDKIF